MSKLKLFLKSIKYTGKNIGKDLDFVIRTFETTYKLSLDLKNWTKKEFDPPEFITDIENSTDGEILQAPMHILVIEDDPINDDIGWEEKTHKIKISPNQPAEFKHIVEIRERGGVRTKKNIAIFEFSFIIDYTAIIHVPDGNVRLPDLFPPLKLTRGSSYLPPSCDLLCIQKCGYGDLECIAKCCV